MKYALLIYSSPELRDIPEDQLKSIVSEYDAILHEPGVLDSMQLQGTESATTVCAQNGEAPPKSPYRKEDLSIGR